MPVPVERPEFLTNCGLGDTGLLNVEEGISPGYGDDYHPWLDGQWIDVTGLSAGRYVLVHRVNKARLLAESSYANNASSVLVALSWPTGKQGLPKLTVLRTCPNKARCTKPRYLGSGRADDDSRRGESAGVAELLPEREVERGGRDGHLRAGLERARPSRLPRRRS